MSVSKAHIRASKKYNDEKLYRMAVNLRRVDDADIIESLAFAKDHGVSYRKWLRALYDRYYEEDAAETDPDDTDRGEEEASDALFDDISDPER